jgi:hypothetical protein
MQLDLSTDETTVLADVLDSALRDTRQEVYKAELAEYKDSLRHRESILAGLLERVGGTPR